MLSTTGKSAESYSGSLQEILIRKILRGWRVCVDLRGFVFLLDFAIFVFIHSLIKDSYQAYKVVSTIISARNIDKRKTWRGK